MDTLVLVTDSCELRCGCWEMNLDPLQKQKVFLAAVPSPQPPSPCVLNGATLYLVKLPSGRTEMTLLVRSKQ